MVCTGGCNTERVSPPKEVEAGAPGSQHKLHRFWCLLRTWSRGYSSNVLWSRGV